MTSKQQFSLPRSRDAYDSHGPGAAFTAVLNDELRSLDITMLPLQQGLRASSMALADKLSATILAQELMQQTLRIHAGLFYTGLIAGCNCADDPTPQDEINEYCEVVIRIDMRSARASAALVEQ